MSDQLKNEWITVVTNMVLALLSTFFGVSLLYQYNSSNLVGLGWMIFFLLFGINNVLAAFAHGLNENWFLMKWLWRCIYIITISMVLVLSFAAIKLSSGIDPLKVLLIYSLVYFLIGGIIFRGGKNGWNFTLAYVFLLCILNIVFLFLYYFSSQNVKALFLIAGILLAQIGLYFQFNLKKKQKKIYIFNYNDIFHFFLILAVLIAYFGMLP